jgi:hypothetical protein
MSELINPYDTATKIRNLEIRLFWQRSNYFLVLNTAIATGALFKADKPEYTFPLAIFGFLVSLMWISINLGSKYWQDRWERKIAKIERNIDPTLELFYFPPHSTVIDEEVRESLRYNEVRWYRLWKRFVNFFVMLKPSVSRTMILLSVSFGVFWAMIFLYSMGFQLKPPIFNSASVGVVSDSLRQSVQNPTDTSKLPWFMSWDSIWHFIAIVAGVLLAFWLERRFSAKRNLSVQKSLVRLISDEVERNIQLMTQIVEEAKRTVVPYYQLVTENKDSCWSMVVEYPFADSSIVKAIAVSYFEYRLINRTLDMLFFKEGLKSSIFANSTLPLCKAEIERSTILLTSLREWANK